MVQKKEEKSEQILNYEANIFLIQMIRFFALIVLIIFLLPLLFYYIEIDSSSNYFSYFRPAFIIEKNISSFLVSILPIEIPDINMIRWALTLVAFILILSFNRIKKHYKNKIEDVKLKKEYEGWKEKRRISGDAKVLVPLKKKIERLSPSANKKEREELLRLFAETKKKLDAMGKTLTFLSIDVVDSSGLKEGEEKASIEYDFREYKRFVEGILKANRAMKSTWTPDGSMSVFQTADAAVKAAQEVLVGLSGFNKEVKTLKKEFRVRCGINEGYVYFDNALPLEEMSDHVIDAAGHMQKHALPNTLYLSQSAVGSLKEKTNMVAANKTIDGYEVYVWSKE